MKKLLVYLLIFFMGMPLLAQNKKRFLLYGQMFGRHTLANGNETFIWGFSHQKTEGNIPPVQLPAPTIVVNEGDSVEVMFINDSDEGHTIHFHGLDTDQENDGVPHTSNFVLTGDTFTYKFKATHAGNYIYHCHVTTTLHLVMGMYGAFIVKAKNGQNQVYTAGPDYDLDHVILTSELQQAWNDNFTTGGALNEYHPDNFLVNGKAEMQLFADSTQMITLLPNQKTLLRYINIGFYKNEVIFPSTITAIAHTSDGRPLPNPIQVSATGINIYPGERYGILLENNSSNLVTGYVTINYYSLITEELEATVYLPINNLIPKLFVNKISFFNQHAVIFPNPTSGVFYSPTEIKIEIYDLTGNLVFVENQWQKSFYVGNLKSGLYLIKMKYKNGKLVTQKLVIN